MPQPASYFDRVPVITSHGKMMDTLKARSATQGKLVWLPGVKGTQRTQDGRYELRGTKSKDILMYYAWSLQVPIPKLLGYSHDPQLARNFCEAHHIGSGT
jgi:hypothetical protein